MTNLSAAIDAFLARDTSGQTRRQLAAELIALRYACDQLWRIYFEMAKDV